MENGVDKKTTQNFGGILAVYSIGLLVGGLYVGMVAPLRTVVQAQFGIGDGTGIWMINIYTLFYAALIPVIGKIADRYGRNLVFTVCIIIFMAGALLCGLSSHFSGSEGSWMSASGIPGTSDHSVGFGILLAGRVIQAAGAGGMIPVANAEIGTSFPKEKRGFALGIAAAVTGIANVLGAGVGSAVTAIVGPENWAVVFYAAVPICIIVFIGTRIFLKRSTRSEAGKMDCAGSVLLILLVLMLLLGLKGLDFFNISGSFAEFSIWGPLAAAVVFGIVFVLVEKRAVSPVFHMEFLKSRPIVITMIASFFIGCIIVAMMLVPEYAEFIMNDPVGSGGFYMLAIGVMSMAGPPLGGKLIDRFGPKRVLLFGLVIMVAGYLFLALYVSTAPSVPMLVAGLAVVGLGMGFAMGAPTNYMILENTDQKDSTSAIATVTLIRQIGTTIAPAIYVGLITAGSGAAGAGIAGTGAAGSGAAASGISGAGSLGAGAAGLGVAGYQHMLLCVAAFGIITSIVMLFYRSPE